LWNQGDFQTYVLGTLEGWQSCACCLYTTY